MPTKEFKSGFVSIIGRPNVGKSTLLNQILKEKVAIVTPKAQTTRNQIQGIYTTDNEQIVFIDTPGFHKASTELGNFMNDAALSSLKGADVVLLLVDLTKPFDELDSELLKAIDKLKIPALLVANKVDLIHDQETLVKKMEQYRSAGNFINGLSISATHNFNIGKLLETIVALLPNGPMYYPEDQLLVQPERFIVAEIIREKILLHTEQEVPHSVAILIERFKEASNKVEIFATIVVERPSQKKIIIGKDGTMIKKIGIDARKDIQKLLGVTIYLELFVKVEKDWRNKKYQLKEYGYINDDM